MAKKGKKFAAKKKSLMRRTREGARARTKRRTARHGRETAQARTKRKSISRE